MNNPLFSIIVPVYNVEPYIATCIESSMSFIEAITKNRIASISIILIFCQGRSCLSTMNYFKYLSIPLSHHERCSFFTFSSSTKWRCSLPLEASLWYR